MATAAEFGQAVAICRGTPAHPLVEPEDLLGSKIVDATPQARALGIADGDAVTVASRRGSVETVAKVTAGIREGTVFMPFHYAESAVNPHTNTATDPIAKIPELKVCAVRVERKG